MRRTLRRGLLALALVTAAAGTVGAARQRRAAAATRRGTLRPLGPDGGSIADGTAVADDATGPHAALARWHPTPPRTRGGRALARVWAAPLTALGVAAALAGGTVPRWDAARGCLVATDVGGPMGAFVRGNGAAAATLGVVVLCCQPTPSARLLDHEAVHVRQQERLGPLFAVAYALAQATWGYRRNPFEIAARAATAVLSGPAASA